MSLTFFLILAIAYFIQNAAMSAWFKRRFGRAENFITANAPNDAQRFFGVAIYITMLYYLPVAIYLATGFDFWGLFSLMSPLNTPLWQVTGLALGLVALLLMTLTRLNLGSSWRVGLDYTTTDALVTTGFYRTIRNPYFTFFLGYQFALALVAPNALSLGAFIQTTILLNLQTRFEETFLIEKYGAPYLTYKQVTGRFLPKLTS
jgi:protein-S-isoprenylcysteine O-methyltransferase Ste14